jgi:hypothetical protein
MMNLKTLALAAALTTAMSAAPASAALLTGLTVQLSHQFPVLGSFDQGPTDYTVGTSAPISYYGLGTYSAGDTTFIINMSSGSTWTNASFNGFALRDTYGVAAAFTSVSIDPSTNYAGFDASRLSFDADTVSVNLQGLQVDGLIVININGATGAVPEPQSWAMLIAGFGLVGAAARRRRAVAA